MRHLGGVDIRVVRWGDRGVSESDRYWKGRENCVFGFRGNSDTGRPDTGHTGVSNQWGKRSGCTGLPEEEVIVDLGRRTTWLRLTDEGRT